MIAGISGFSEEFSQNLNKVLEVAGQKIELSNDLDKAEIIICNHEVKQSQPVLYLGNQKTDNTILAHLSAESNEQTSRAVIQVLIDYYQFTKNNYHSKTPVILVNNYNQIVFANNPFLNLADCGVRDIIGKSIETFIISKEGTFLKRSNQFEIEVETDNYSISLGDFNFKVLTVNDISERETYSRSLVEANKKLDEYVEELKTSNESNEENRKILELKNEEMLSSLRYASSIQGVFHCDQRKQREFFPKSFQIFKPQNIVSGDVIWIAETHIGYAAVSIDCMGHGVPGALLSISVIQCLETINEQGFFYSATDFLSKVVELYIKSFNNDITDTFDISVCIFDDTTGLMFFQGIKRPLLFQSDGHLEYIKGMSEDIVRFHELSKKKQLGNDIVRPYKKGDRFYLFSDGYVDQFGGIRNKKFKLNQLKELIVATSNEEIEIQGEILNEAFEEWKNHSNGDGEQTDDVSLLGIEISVKLKI